MENLHIVSWNVQHWKATIDNIKKDFGSFENWLEKLKIDILCLQEVGVQVKDINIKYGSEPKGYESFWSWICLLYTSPSPRDRTRSRMRFHLYLP